MHLSYWISLINVTTKINKNKIKIKWNVSLKWITHLRGRVIGYGVTYFDVTSLNLVQTLGGEKKVIISDNYLAHFYENELGAPL